MIPVNMIYSKNKRMIQKRKRSLLLTNLVMIMLMILPCVVFAQDPGDNPDAPIDGGLGILLAAGTAYGVKKYRDSRAKSGKGR